MHFNSIPTYRPAILAIAAMVGLLLALILLPAAASAGELQPTGTDPGQCALCHQAEVQDWQSSPHAAATSAIENALMTCKEGEDCSCLTCHTTNFSPVTGEFEHTGVTCEACHGPMVEGHPEDGVMNLSVDSSVCQDCHAETFADWASTPHAQADVQCIGCHRSHTQNLRLEDQALCKSCHREQLQDAGHQAHIRTGLDCVSCHTTPASSPHAMDGPSAPSHQFAVNTEVCADCHSNIFHRSATTAAIAAAQPVGAAAGIQPSEAAQIVAGQASAQRTAQASAIALGVGIGIGVLAGIIFMLVLALLTQRPWRGKS